MAKQVSKNTGKAGKANGKAAKAAPAKRTQRVAINPQGRITIVAGGQGKHPVTGAVLPAYTRGKKAANFKRIKSGQTVAAFVAAGGSLPLLQTAMRFGRVAVK